MSLESFNNAPKQVKKAYREGNVKAHRAMSRKGGQRSAEYRAMKKESEAEADLAENKDHLYRELLLEHGEERAEEIMKELEGR